VALLGTRGARNGHWDLTAVLLAGYPFVFPALQSYGASSCCAYTYSPSLMSFFMRLIFPETTVRVPVATGGDRRACGCDGVRLPAARYGNDVQTD
jgi:hypothetical protein